MEQISAFVAYQAIAANTKKKSSKSNSSKQANKKTRMISTNGETPQQTHKRKSASDHSEIASPTKTPSFTNRSGTISVGSQDSTVSSSQGSNRSSQSNSIVNPQSTGRTQMNKNKRQQTNERSVFDKSSSTMAGPSNGIQMDNSFELGENFFANLIGGIDRDDFMAKFWERKPLHIARRSPEIYKSLGISLTSVDEMLRSNVIEFTKNLDITSYIDGKRETHNPDGRAMPDTVWGYYNDGCSVRLLNPQTFMPQLHRFNATLQEYFHCLVGANIYITPSGSQGFAPHYDDIEAFVLQIEGKKRWRIYRPRSEAEKLPRESSGNFTESDVKDMELAIEVILEPGDLLYFPRGHIHQANTVEGHHSLHVTLSVYQNTSFADLFEDMMKQTLQKTIASEVSFRYGLPLDIWYNFGASYQNLESERKEHIKDHIRILFERLIGHIDVDEAVDRLAVKFQHDALPPFITQSEKRLLSIGTQAAPKKNGEMAVRFIHGNTEVRLLRANCCRVTTHDGELRLYYYLDNSKEYHEFEVNYIELDDSAVLIAKKLIHTYPAFIKIRELDNDFENALSIARALWERGLLMTNKPL